MAAFLSGIVTTRLQTWPHSGVAGAAAATAALGTQMTAFQAATAATLGAIQGQLGPAVRASLVTPPRRDSQDSLRPMQDRAAAGSAESVAFSPEPLDEEGPSPTPPFHVRCVGPCGASHPTSCSVSPSTCATSTAEIVSRPAHLYYAHLAASLGPYYDAGYTERDVEHWDVQSTSSHGSGGSGTRRELHKDVTGRVYCWPRRRA